MDSMKSHTIPFPLLVLSYKEYMSRPILVFVCLVCFMILALFKLIHPQKWSLLWLLCYFYHIFKCKHKYNLCYSITMVHLLFFLLSHMNNVALIWVCIICVICHATFSHCFSLSFLFHFNGAKVTDESIFFLQLPLSFQSCQPSASERNDS